MTDNEKPKTPLWGMDAPPVLQAPIYTEVRMRQFYRTLDGGQEVLPSTVFYVPLGGVMPDLASMAQQIADAVMSAVQAGVRPMGRDELRAFIRAEITSASSAASSGKASWQALPEDEMPVPPGGYDA